MSILTKPQIAAFQRAKAVANDVLPKIEFIEGMAKVNGAMQERAKELRARREYLVQLAETALELDRSLGQEIQKQPFGEGRPYPNG